MSTACSGSDCRQNTIFLVPLQVRDLSLKLQYFTRPKNTLPYDASCRRKGQSNGDQQRISISHVVECRKQVQAMMRRVKWLPVSLVQPLMHKSRPEDPRKHALGGEDPPESRCEQLGVDHTGAPLASFSLVVSLQYKADLIELRTKNWYCTALSSEWVHARRAYLNTKPMFACARTCRSCP